MTAVIVTSSLVAFDPGIHQEISRAAVEAAHRLARIEVGQVGDAAEVEDHTVLARVAEYGGMKGRHQGRALAAGGDVAAAEIGDDGDPAEFGQQRRIVQLYGVAGGRLVADGLAVAADG